MRALAVSSWIFAAATACSPPLATPLATPTASALPAAADRCATIADCVAVQGDPCGPCGACPGTPHSALSRAHLAELMAADDCPQRAIQHGALPPQCEPCMAAPPGPADTRQLACVAGVCVME